MFRGNRLVGVEWVSSSYLNWYLVWKVESWSFVVSFINANESFFVIAFWLISQSFLTRLSLNGNLGNVYIFCQGKVWSAFNNFIRFRWNFFACFLLFVVILKYHIFLRRIKYTLIKNWQDLLTNGNWKLNWSFSKKGVLNKLAHLILNNSYTHTWCLDKEMYVMMIDFGPNIQHYNFWTSYESYESSARYACSFRCW